MTQDARWLTRYNEVRDFMDKSHRNPSKHRVEEHLMLNFIKHNRKLLNAGKMKPEIVEMLQALMEECKRCNQRR